MSARKPTERAGPKMRKGAGGDLTNWIKYRDQLFDDAREKWAEDESWMLLVYGLEPEDKYLQSSIALVTACQGNPIELGKAQQKLDEYKSKKKARRNEFFIWIWKTIDTDDQEKIKRSNIHASTYQKVNKESNIVGLFILLEDYFTRSQMVDGANELNAESQYKAIKMAENESIQDASKRILDALEIYVNLLPFEQRDIFKTSSKNILDVFKKLNSQYVAFGMTPEYKNVKSINELLEEAEKWYTRSVETGNIVPSNLKSSTPRGADSLVGTVLTKSALKKIRKKAKSEALNVTSDSGKSSGSSIAAAAMTSVTTISVPKAKENECQLCTVAKYLMKTKDVRLNHKTEKCFVLKNWGNLQVKKEKESANYVGVTDAFVLSTLDTDSHDEVSLFDGENVALMVEEFNSDDPHSLIKKEATSDESECSDSNDADITLSQLEWEENTIWPVIEELTMTDTKPGRGINYITNSPRQHPNYLMNFIEAGDASGGAGVDKTLSVPPTSPGSWGCSLGAPPGPTFTKASYTPTSKKDKELAETGWKCGSCAEENPASSDTCLGCCRTSDAYIRRVSQAHPNMFSQNRSVVDVVPVASRLRLAKSEDRPPLLLAQQPGSTVQQSPEAAISAPRNYVNKLLVHMREIEKYFHKSNPTSMESLYATKLAVYLHEDILKKQDHFALMLEESETRVNEVFSISPKSSLDFSGKMKYRKRSTYFRDASFRSKNGIVVWDTGCVNHFFNRSLMHLCCNIRKLHEPRVFHGVGGDAVVTEEGDMRILKNIVFFEKCPKNLVSQSQLVDEGFNIAYHAESDSITASKGNSMLLFVRDGRLYVLDTVFEDGVADDSALLASSNSGAPFNSNCKLSPNQPDLVNNNPPKPNPSFNQTAILGSPAKSPEFNRKDSAAFYAWLDSNSSEFFELSAGCLGIMESCFDFSLGNFSKKYTKVEIKRANLARMYHRLTGHRGRQAEIDEINRGGMKNCDVTVADLVLSDEICGPCPVCHRAKAFNPKPTQPVRKKTERAGEIQHFDVMFLRGADKKPVPVMIFVDEATHKVLLIKSRTRKKIAIEDGVKLVTQWYQSRGFLRPKLIFSDNEKSVHAYSKKFRGKVSFKAAGEHVGLAETYIGAIKMILRTIILDLPYNFPMFYLNYLLKEAAMLLALKPTSRTDGVSVLEKIRGVKPDFEKLKYPFGAYGLATTPKSQVIDDLQPHSEYGIMLSRPATGDLNFKVLLLDKMSVVSRKNFTVLPFDSTVIDRINALSDKLSKVDESLTDNLDEKALGGDLTDGISIEMSDDDVKDPFDIPRVAEHFKDGKAFPGFHNYSIRAEPVFEHIEANTDEGYYKPTLDNTEIDRLLDNQKSLNMDETIEYGRGKRKVTKPELLSLLANTLVKHRTTVESRMSTRKAYQKHGETAEISNLKELQQIVEKNVIRPYTYSDLRKNDKIKNKTIIRSFTFFKEKFDLSGLLAKLKARLVAGGQMVDVEELGDIASPTVKMEVVMLLFSLASYLDWKVSVLDVPGAFLHTKLPEDEQIPMVVGKLEAEVLVKLRTDWAKYLLPNGEMLVLITGGLYGLPQSPKLWYDALKTAILKLRYKQCSMDPCVFIKIVSDTEKSIISLHVDDLGHFYTHNHFQKELVDMITKNFTAPTIQSGDEGVYLGLEYKFNRADKSVEIGMSKFVEKLLEEFDIKKGSNTCCTQNFMDVDQDAEKIDPKKFAGAVMSLYYLASRVRRDLLFAVTVMSTRIHSCNVSDEKKLLKIFRYLFATKDRKILIKLDGLELKFYIDASYALHHNARSHTGLVVSLGSKFGGPLFARSIVQKLVTLSSFEAELNGVHQNVYWFHLFRTVMSEFGFPQNEPSVLYQDNQATILVMNRGNTFRGRSKHVDVRYYYLTELINNGVIRVEYMPTNEMIADPLTKPKSAAVDESEMKRLQNSEV